MDQHAIRQYVERYMAAFSAHVMEAHPDYLSVTLPVEVDKDIGNRPFYWTWVEKMNLPYQPLTLTFFFNQDAIPQGMRGEPLHFGSARLGQIFHSARSHGQFICLYEHSPAVALPSASRGRRSIPLTPWLGLNLKVSFICDKKRDLLLYYGVNLYQPRLVTDFYPFLKRLNLSPAIPDYHFTLERRIALSQATQMVEQEINRLIANEDATWAMEARERLQEEIEILEGYYAEWKERESQGSDDGDETDRDAGAGADSGIVASVDGSVDNAGVGADVGAGVESVIDAGMDSDVGTNQTNQLVHLSPGTASPSLPTSPEPGPGSMRILDFLRMNGIQETPREQIAQEEWVSSSPEEEKQRRIAELKWQYEPRIEIAFINGGIFYLQNQPPFH